MQHAGPLPALSLNWAWAVNWSSKWAKFRKFKNSESSEVSEDSWPVECLLKVRKVTFSSDSSRKWLSQWLVGENLDRSWWGALLCSRMLGSVSEHHSLEQGTISPCRFTCFVKIRESATRSVILLMDFSLLSWWDTTYMLQILLIYNAMKLINIIYLSSLFWNQCLAGKACPTWTGDTSLPKCLLNKDSVQTFLLNFLYAVYMQIVVHDKQLILTSFQLSCVGNFQLQCFFPLYLFFFIQIA